MVKRLDWEYPFPPSNSKHRCRIVVTGVAGEATAADMFRREIGERIVVVPEAATTAVQRAIYHVQRNHENVQAEKYQ